MRVTRESASCLITGQIVTPSAISWVCMCVSDATSKYVSYATYWRDFHIAAAALPVLYQLMLPQRVTLVLLMLTAGLYFPKPPTLVQWGVRVPPWFVHHLLMYAAGVLCWYKWISWGPRAMQVFGASQYLRSCTSTWNVNPTVYWKLQIHEARNNNCIKFYKRTMQN